MRRASRPEEHVEPGESVQDKPPEFMKRSEAAAFVNLSPDMVDRLVRSGLIPFIDLSDLGLARPGARPKKLIRFSRSSLTAWMHSRERTPNGFGGGTE